MSGADKQGDLFPGQGVPVGAVVINDRCLVRTQDKHRVVIVSGIVLSQYALGDAMAEAHAMVSLVEQGLANQNDVARAFGCSTRTVRRHQRRFGEGGLAALGRQGGYPAGRPRLAFWRSRLVNRLKADGVAHREIARRLGVTPKAARKLLRRLGWVERKPEQQSLPLRGKDEDPQRLGARKPEPRQSSLPSGGDPNLSASLTTVEEPPPLSFDPDPANRQIDRLLACLGLLDDAAPLFRLGTRVPRAGVLLALPALIASGVFEIARTVYGSIGPAFYGLRTTLVVALLMALMRIKRPESLKEHAPPDLGRLLGLDRAPEVKTLRRKLSRLAAFGCAVAFGRGLAERRVATRGASIGLLYVDGHVRAYHGKRTLPKAHLARMRLSMPGTTDYWVNDRKGDPLFVVTAEANAGLVRMLKPVLAEVRRLVGKRRRVTIVFDRGGWSPKLFKELIASGFDILTYRKGRIRRVARRRFQTYTTRIEGHRVRYALADQQICLLKGKLRLRQITRLSENGHQTPVVTSRRDLKAVEVAHRMFERWRQENFFKYLREEYALDALVDYAVEPADANRDVPNPARKLIDEKLREARATLERLKAEFGMKAIVAPDDLTTRTKANVGFRRELVAALDRLANLEKRRAKMPKRVPVAATVEGEVIKLSTERKHLTNLFKMVAYQAESDLVRQIAPHYARAEEEGRTLVQSALNSAGDIEVADHELRVRLAPLSSPHRSRAAAALCAELNRTDTLFPGTRLRLRYAVDGPG